MSGRLRNSKSARVRTNSGNWTVGLERRADEYWRMARALVEKEMAVPDASNTCDSGVLASG